MSQVVFTRAFAHNFNSFESFDLPIEPGKFAVIGANGNGKSSVLESIINTLYGFYMRGNDPSRDHKGDCMTGVAFTIGKDEYIVERYHRHPKHKNKALLFLNGKDVSDRLSVSIDERIVQLIGIPRDLFISTCVVMQGLPINFTQLTPAIRKNIIEDAIGCSVWDDYKSKVDKNLTSLNGDMQAFEEKKTTLEQEIAVNQGKLESLEKTQSAEADRIQVDVDKAKADLEKAKIDSAKKKLVLDTSSKEFGDQNVLKTKLNKCKSKHTLLLNRARDLKEIVEQNVCPTCNRAYPKAQLEEAQSELDGMDDAIEAATNAVRELEKCLEGLVNQSNLVARASGECSLIEGNLRRLQSRLAEALKGHSGEVDEIAELLKSATTELEALLTEGAKLEERISHVQYVKDLLLPSSAFRTQMLVDYLVHINGILDKIVPLLMYSMKVSLGTNARATGVDLVVEREGEKIEYKALSGGEKRRVDIAIILAFQRFLIQTTGISTNLVSFDEITDGLDMLGLDLVMCAIESLFPEDSSVFVISHSDLVKSRFDKVIHVHKDNKGISRINT